MDCNYKTIIFLLKWISIKLKNHRLEYKNNILQNIGNTICSILGKKDSHGMFFHEKTKKETPLILFS